MQKHRLLAIVSIFAISIALSLGFTPDLAAKEKVYKWRAQTYAVPGSVGYKSVEMAMESLKKATGGRLEIKLHGVGTLVGAFDQLDAMGKGIFECGFNAPAYYAGNDPAFAALFSLMNLWDSTTDVKVWAYYFGGNELARELYGKYKVHYVGPALVGAEPIMSKVPLKSLADFNGIKIRTAGGLTAALFTKLGASPVKLPGGELYTGLDTGVVDAAPHRPLEKDPVSSAHRQSAALVREYPAAACGFAFQTVRATSCRHAGNAVRKTC